MYRGPNIKPARYDAASEIKFINGLGTYGIAEKEGANNKSREELLRGYLIAANKRTDWGHIDKHLVIQHAKLKLLELAA